MRNPEVMLLDTFEDPQFIHDLMRFATDYCKRWGDAIVKTKIGLSFSEPTASISLISPDNYREFVAPYHKELVDHFKAKKVGVTTHICGTTYPIYEDLIALRVRDRLLRPRPAGRSRSSTSTSSRGSWRSRGAGRWPSATSTRRKFERATQAGDGGRCAALHRHGARHSGFILSTSCEIPPRSNPEIVKWFMDATREYGRYERFMS